MLLPDLSATDFVNFEAEFALPLSSDLPEELKGKVRNRHGCDLESFPKNHYLLSLDAKVDKNLLLSVKMESTALFSLKIIDPDVYGRLSAAEIQKRLERLVAGRELVVDSRCSFEVPVSELPPSGIVRHGIGRLFRFHEDELLLSGAQFAINGDTENTISWFIEAGSEDLDTVDTVFGTVFRRAERDCDSDTFREIVEHAQQQYERYILERSAAPLK